MSDISRKQIDANQENAKKGGVKTEAGKEVSKQNAIKHGLLSEKVVLESEDAENYNKLVQSLRDQMNPADQIEAVLVERIAGNIWRLRRLAMIESQEMFESQLDRGGVPLENPLGESENRVPNLPDKDDLKKFNRYERMLEKSMYKALHELQRIQSARAGDSPPAPMAVDVST